MSKKEFETREKLHVTQTRAMFAEKEAIRYRRLFHRYLTICDKLAVDILIIEDAKLKKRQKSK